jgi:hypothetical protein
LSSSSSYLFTFNFMSYLETFVDSPLQIFMPGQFCDTVRDMKCCVHTITSFFELYTQWFCFQHRLSFHNPPT